MKNQIKKAYAIIPSAGSGTRFDAALPKQYFNINEELIIEKTINHFLEIDEIKKIIIPLGEQDEIFSNLDIAKNEKIQTVQGGKTRAESVLNALETIKENSLVVVHDAVRPFINSDMIRDLMRDFDEETDDALIYGIPIYEALKKINPDNLSIKKSVDRNKYYLAQTPQICLSSVLKESINYCLKDDYNPGDESEAIEKTGGKIRFLPGNRSNIKITVQEDLLNEKIGNISYYDSRGDSTFTKPYSEATAKIIDEEVSAIIESAYTKAKDILTTNRNKLEELANALLQHEVIYKEDVEKILGPRPGDAQPAVPSDVQPEAPSDSTTDSQADLPVENSGE